MSSEPAVEVVEGTSFHLEPRQKLEILFAILLALFLFALDQTVVSVALPVIVTDLQGENVYTWAVTIYLLTATISGPIYGKLSDLYGRRPIFIWALGLFMAASIGAGLSNQMWQFILFRGLQGLGGGAVFPIALAVVADLYPPQERAKYGALFGAVFGLSSVIGPAVGGILTDTFGWPSIFFVNVPLVAISLVICWRLLPPIKHPDAGRNIDYVGAALLAASIGPFLIGLTNKQRADWTDPWVGGLIVLGLLIGVVFLWWERRAVDPIVNLNLFRIRNVAIALAGMFFVGFGFFGAIIFLPRWFQEIAGATRHTVGLQPAAAGRRAHLQRHPERPDRLSYRPLQVADRGLDGHPRGRPVPDDQPQGRYQLPGPVGVDGHHRPRHRTGVRRLHGGGPEQRVASLRRARRPPA